MPCGKLVASESNISTPGGLVQSIQQASQAAKVELINVVQTRQADGATSTCKSSSSIKPSSLVSVGNIRGFITTHTHVKNHAKTAKKNQNNPWANDIPEVGFQVSIHCPASPACLVWRCTCISPINGNRTGSVLIQNHFPGKAYDSYAQAHHESSELQIRAHTQPPSDHGHLCL